MKKLLLSIVLIVVLCCTVGCVDQSDTTAAQNFTSNATSCTTNVSTVSTSQITNAADTSSTVETTTTALPTSTSTPATTTVAPTVTTTVNPPAAAPPYVYNDFTDAEKNTYRISVGFVIPFLQNNDYFVEAYNEDGYIGVYFSALCDKKSSFTAYLNQFNRYQNDGTDTDDYGDIWYLFSNDTVYIDVCYYEYDGDYYVDVDVYIDESENAPDNNDNDNNNTDTPSYDEENLLTNNGAGLPSDNGSGVHSVDFTKAENVKDVTDQGYYLDGCPTVGSPDVLVIPVDFSDVTAKSKGYSIDVIKRAFLQNGTTDYYSVYDYFYQSSYGQLTLDVTILDFWFRPQKTSTYYASQTMDYYGVEVDIGDQIILNEALDYLEDVMDLSAFDSDKNGIIDSVVLITTLDVNEESNFYWAFRYWNIYTDDQDYYYEYDGVSANDYLWAPYQMLHESYDKNGNSSYNDTSVLNTYTLIHEFSHILGADDYYDTAYEYDPMHGFDIMDSMTGDHNPYSKFNYGWITTSKLIVTETSVTLQLEDFSKNGDTVILAANWNDSLGAYQEYYILMYYTNTGLNGGDYGYFERNGIVVYHVNATLYYEEFEGIIYYDVNNNNTSPSDSYGSKDNLIELVASKSGNYTYVAGDSLGKLTDDNDNALPYSFTVNEITSDYATVTFTKQ